MASIPASGAEHSAVPQVQPVAVLGAGPLEVVPPPSVPLGALAAAGVGLTGLGLVTLLTADRVAVAPTDPGVVAAVHVGVLAFLTTAVLGALHQFAPVIGRRPLRSVIAARLALAGMVATAWLLPTGFAHGPSWLVPAGGVVGAASVVLAVWNLSAPLASPVGGLPASGLRIALAYLVATVAFGVVYAFDRQAGWFPLLPHRVLAHAHLGLVGWLGLTYVSVAEKLWPMFLLAHRPSARAGVAAVRLTALGAAPLAAGLLLTVGWLAWTGGLVVAAGLAAHLVSLATCVRHRRRRLELLHAYLFTSTAFLIAAMALGLAAAAADVSPAIRGRLVAAEVAAAIAWLGLAVVGHAHKIVPFIGYGTLRARGIRNHHSGRPLLFSDLYARWPARLALIAGVVGFTAIVAGIVTATTAALATGGIAVAACGVAVTANLATGPRRATAPGRPPAPPDRALTPGAAHDLFARMGHVAHAGDGGGG